METSLCSAGAPHTPTQPTQSGQVPGRATTHPFWGHPPRSSWAQRPVLLPGGAQRQGAVAESLSFLPGQVPRVLSFPCKKPRPGTSAALRETGGERALPR